MTTTRTASAVAAPDAPWGREVSSELILDYAQPRSVALQVFDRRLTNMAELAMPIIDAPADAAWVAEGAEITATDPTLAEIVVRPAKVAVLSAFSREALNDDATGALTAAEIVSAGIASKIDEAMFTAAGGAAPVGLTGITPNAVDADPATSLDGYLAAAAHAESLGTTVGSFVLNPADWAALSQLKKQTGSLEPLLTEVTGTPRRTIAGAQVFVTEHVTEGTAWALPRDAGRIIVREDLDVTVDASRYLEYDRIAVRCIMRVGFGIVRPSTVSLIAPVVP